jgi:hypothetical protein
MVSIPLNVHSDFQNARGTTRVPDSFTGPNHIPGIAQPGDRDCKHDDDCNRPQNRSARIGLRQQVGHNFHYLCPSAKPISACPAFDPQAISSMLPAIREK